jgi:hypothetical protein
MDAVQILNIYRFSLANDGIALRILAHLLRSGSLDEGELARRTNLENHALRLKLNELFRAQLVFVVQPNRWSTTDIAGEILSRLGISEAVVRSALASQGIADVDRSFLEACVQAQSYRDSRWSRYQTTLLRSAEALRSGIFHNVTQSREKLSYSIVVGFDSDLHLLGGREYCRSIVGKHRELRSDLWQKYGDFWAEGESRLAQRCDAAAADAQASNFLLIWDAPETASREIPQHTLSLTLIRLLGAVLSKFADSGLSASFRANRDFPENVLSFIEKRYDKATLDEGLGELLCSLGKTREEGGSFWKATLREGLEELLTSEGVQSHEGLRQLGMDEVQVDVNAKLGILRGEWLERILVRVKWQIEEGHYDYMSPSQQRRVLDLLAESSLSLSSRACAGGSENESAIEPRGGQP